MVTGWLSWPKLPELMDLSKTIFPHRNIILWPEKINYLTRLLLNRVAIYEMDVINPGGVAHGAIVARLFLQLMQGLSDGSKTLIIVFVKG